MEVVVREMLDSGEPEVVAENSAVVAAEELPVAIGLCILRCVKLVVICLGQLLLVEMWRGWRRNGCGCGWLWLLWLRI